MSLNVIPNPTARGKRPTYADRILEPHSRLRFIHKAIFQSGCELSLKKSSSSHHSSSDQMSRVLRKILRQPTLIFDTLVHLFISYSLPQAPSRKVDLPEVRRILLLTELLGWKNESYIERLEESEVADSLGYSLNELRLIMLLTESFIARVLEGDGDHNVLDSVAVVAEDVVEDRRINLPVGAGADHEVIEGMRNEVDIDLETVMRHWYDSRVGETSWYLR